MQSQQSMMSNCSDELCLTMTLTCVVRRTLRWARPDLELLKYYECFHECHHKDCEVSSGNVVSEEKSEHDAAVLC